MLVARRDCVFVMAARRAWRMCVLFAPAHEDGGEVGGPEDMRFYCARDMTGKMLLCVHGICLKRLRAIHGCMHVW